MNYALFADLTALIHITILVAVVIGLLVCFRYKRFVPWEAATVLTIVLLWSYFGNCPLALIEDHFRKLAGQETGLTTMGFTSYYAWKLFGLSLPSRVVQRYTFFTAGVLFMGSIEWFEPLLHREVFRFRRLLGMKPKRKRRYA
jgi:hypothetical protein